MSSPARSSSTARYPTTVSYFWDIQTVLAQEWYLGVHLPAAYGGVVVGPSAPVSPIYSKRWAGDAAVDDLRCTVPRPRCRLRSGSVAIFPAQSEYWTSRQIEDALHDAGYEVDVDLVSQDLERRLPADFILLDEHQAVRPAV
jgi:hypothetical protein